MREIDAGLDPARLMKQIKEMNANAIIFSVGGIRAFYQTSLTYHRKASALKSDLAVEARKAAHATGLRFIARCDMSKADASFYLDNPAWFQCDAQGRPHLYNGLHICCPNGEYYRDYSHKIIAEIIERVQPDALFFNMFGFTSHDYAGNEIPLCHCAGCKRRYQEFAGRPLPDDMGPRHPDYAKYQEFKSLCVKQVADEYRTLIRDLSGGRCALFTYVDEADIRRMEANSGINREPRTNIFYVAQEVGRSTTMNPGKSCSCAIVNFLDIPYRYAAEPSALTALRLVQALAVGGELDFYVLGTLDQPDKRSFADVAKWFGHYRDHAKEYYQSESLAKTALVNRGGEAFRGAYRLLLDRGVPFDVIDLRDAHAAQGFYSRYELIWYPGMLAADSKEARLLDEYVKGGGTLVTTCDADRPVPAFFGVTAKRFNPNWLTAYWRATPREWLPKTPRAELIFALGPVMECEPLADTEAALSLIPPHSCAPPELAYYTTETKMAGLFIHPHGKGRVAFFPWAVDTLYSQYASPSHRELMLDLLDGLAVASKPARVLGDRKVMITARQSADGSATLLHLINLTGWDGRDIRNPEPMLDVKVKAAPALAASRGTLLVGGRKIRANDGVFTIPRLELFETLAISGER
jgi:hypothetical protein